MAVEQQWLEYSQSSLVISANGNIGFALQSYVVTAQYTNVFGKTYTHITLHNTRITLIT